MLKSLILSSSLLFTPIQNQSIDPTDYYGVIRVDINNVNSYEFDSCYVFGESLGTSKEVHNVKLENDIFYIPKEYGNISLQTISLNFLVNVDDTNGVVRKDTELSNTMLYNGTTWTSGSIHASQLFQVIDATTLKIGLVMYADEPSYYSLNTQYIYSPTYQNTDVGNVELIDVTSLIFTLVSLPFTFIQQAFNLTIFPGTPYQFNFSNLAMIIIGSFFLIFIIQKIMSIKG